MYVSASNSCHSLTISLNTHFPRVGHSGNVTSLHIGRAFPVPLLDHLRPLLSKDSLVSSLPLGKGASGRRSRATVSIELAETTEGRNTRDDSLVTANTTVTRSEGRKSQEIGRVVSRRGICAHLETSSGR